MTETYKVTQTKHANTVAQTQESGDMFFKIGFSLWTSIQIDWMTHSALLLQQKPPT